LHDHKNDIVHDKLRHLGKIHSDGAKIRSDDLVDRIHQNIRINYIRSCEYTDKQDT